MITACAVPRPDLTVTLGTPNACNACHADKSAQWAADAVRTWYGPERKGFQHYAAAFHDAWADRADAERLLTAAASDHETPGFARAGALAELGSRLSAANVGLARSGLADPDPMVRIGALDMLENAPAQDIWPIAAPLLERSGPRGQATGGRSPRGGPGGEPAGRRPRRPSTMPRPSSSRRRSSTPTGRKRG